MKTPPARQRGAAIGRGLRLLVLQSRFNDAVVGGLALGALEYASEVGASAEVELVPGAYELPLVAQTAAFTGRYDAIVALGAVIKGETDHYEHIAREAARGIMNASLTTGVPIAFGVLTVAKAAHALARSGPGRYNKGREATAAAIDAALVLRKLTRAALVKVRLAPKRRA
ncbi:MAG: 6,7-dimethyl-8-ribityllumazine synthase [Vicinamibacteria bacterium]|nr:6,7-dimethyl-8-ribityllumazine synthase [Vicinamibacteria bacterium]